MNWKRSFEWIRANSPDSITFWAMANVLIVTLILAVQVALGVSRDLTICGLKETIEAQAQQCQDTDRTRKVDLSQEPA